MAKDKPRTEPKEKADNSAFQRFDRLAKRIIRVPKANTKNDKSS